MEDEGLDEIMNLVGLQEVAWGDRASRQMSRWSDSGITQGNS